MHVEMPAHNKKLQAHRARVDILSYPFGIHGELYLENKCVDSDNG